MADDDDFEIWDDEFLEKAIQVTEAAASSYSSSNPTQQPAPPPQQLLWAPPPPPPPPHSDPYISYSPPRELSQRVKEDNHNKIPDKGFDFPVSLNGTSHSSRLHEDDKCPKQKEIYRLKEELGRVSKVLTNLEQECLELRKNREKSESHSISALSATGSNKTETVSTKKSNLKPKDPIEDLSAIRTETKGVGVQTDEPTDSTVNKNLSVSRKLVSIWDPQQSKTNLVSKLFVACAADLQALFGLDNCIQAVEAAKVSHLYTTLTQISYDIGRLEDFLDALVDLSCLQNAMIAHRSLCVLHVVLKHILIMENRVASRDNIVINEPSGSFEKHSETGHERQPVLINKIWNNDTLKTESSPLISDTKWFSLYQTVNQIVTRQSEENVRVEAVSIMNILLLRTDAFVERQMYGEVAIFQSISQVLRKEVGVGVQKQTLHLLYLLLNCPNLMRMFCNSCKEEETSGETGISFECSGGILHGLADCLASSGNGPTTLVLKLQRDAIKLLAFLASSGRHGFEILLGRRTNFLYLILQILESEIDLEPSDCVQTSDDFRDRTLLIREALILLNRLASHPVYSTPVLRLVTKRRDMAGLSIDIATRLSRKSQWLLQSDTITRKIRESEIVDLARIFKKRLFTYLGAEK